MRIELSIEKPALDNVMHFNHLYHPPLQLETDSNPDVLLESGREKGGTLSEFRGPPMRYFTINFVHRGSRSE